MHAFGREAFRAQIFPDEVAKFYVIINNEYSFHWF